MLYGQLYADSDPAQSRNSLCTVFSNMENILFEHFTILLSYVLTRNAKIILCWLTAWSRVLLGKLIGLWCVKEFPAFCGTLRFYWPIHKILPPVPILRNFVLELKLFLFSFWLFFQSVVSEGSVFYLRISVVTYSNFSHIFCDLNTVKANEWFVVAYGL